MVVTPSIVRCKKAIEIINNWCRINKMELNRKKSGILQINKSKKKMWKITNIDGIPVVNQYKYLGVTLDNALSLAYHVQKVSEIINKRAKKLSCKIYELNTSTKIIQWQ